jgi:hypothetical protein
MVLKTRSSVFLFHLQYSITRIKSQRIYGEAFVQYAVAARIRQTGVSRRSA